MAKKKLTPRLPSDEKEVFEKGFEGNIADGKKFVTDGHSMFLAAAAPAGMIFPKPDEEAERKPVKDASVQNVFDKAEKRKQVVAHFIGCGKFREDLVVAVIRGERGRYAAFNPYILKFALIGSQADGLAFTAGAKYDKDMMALLRDGKVVGAIMPVRLDVLFHLCDYDLTGPAVEL
jgi:hypothetical protein